MPRCDPFLSVGRITATPGAGSQPSAAARGGHARGVAPTGGTPQVNGTHPVGMAGNPTNPALPARPFGPP